MALSLPGERPARAAASVRPKNLVLGWIEAVRAHRAERLALAALMQMEEWRLDDLGLCRQDVLEAARRPPGEAGGALATARRRRSRG